MNCQPYADAIVDPSAAAPVDLPQHLAGCADCRALAAGHGAAAKLGAAPLPALRSPRLAPRLFAVAAVAVVLSVVGARVLVVQRASTGSARTELGLVSEDPASDAEWAAFTALRQQTSSYARADTDALGSFHHVGQYFALERLSSRSEALSESSAAQESP